MSDKPKIPFHPVFNPSIKETLDAVKEAIAKDDGMEFKGTDATIENCSFTRMSDEEFELYLKTYDNGPTLVAEARRARESEAAALDALRLALPAVAMHTPAGAMMWPENTPKTESGDPDLSRIAGLIAVALAKAGRR